MIERLDAASTWVVGVLGVDIDPAWELIGEIDGDDVVGVLAMTGVGRECRLHRIAVVADRRRQGIGRRLVQAISHHQVVDAEVAETDAASLAFLTAVGFRRVTAADGVVQFQHWNTALATSFDADVANYEAARPGYPDDLWTLLADRCGLGAGTRVLEIGPGTGLATLKLLDMGADVVAVEPGANMAARLRQRIAGRTGEVVESRFEDAELSGPFDVAAAATSFHWTDVAVSVPKVASLLRPGGWLALWWNVHRTLDEEHDPMSDLLMPIVERFQTAMRRAARTYAFDVEARRADITTGGWFELVDEVHIPFQHTHDAASLRALFASFSDWMTLPEPDRTRALDAVAAIVDDHFGGTVTRTYITAVYLARRRC